MNLLACLLVLEEAEDLDPTGTSSNVGTTTTFPNPRLVIHMFFMLA